MKRLIITLVVSAICITAAGAKNKEERFVKKDTNQNGFLSKKEFIAHAKNKHRAKAVFAKKDKNGDGKLSLQEFMGRGKKKST